MHRNLILPAIVAVMSLTLIVETVFLVKSRRDVGELEAKLSDTAGIITKGLDGVRIQLRVREEVNGSEFADSIYYAADEWSRLSREDVEASVRQRVENWSKAVSASSSGAKPGPSRPSAHPDRKALPSGFPSLPSGLPASPSGPDTVPND